MQVSVAHNLKIVNETSKLNIENNTNKYKKNNGEK